MIVVGTLYCTPAAKAHYRSSIFRYRSCDLIARRCSVLECTTCLTNRVAQRENHIKAKVIGYLLYYYVQCAEVQR